MHGTTPATATSRQEFVRNLRERWASGRLRLRVHADDPRLLGLLMAVFATEPVTVH